MKSFPAYLALPLKRDSSLCIQNLDRASTEGHLSGQLEILAIRGVDVEEELLLLTRS